MPNPDPLFAYLDAVRERCNAATPGPWKQGLGDEVWAPEEPISVLACGCDHWPECSHGPAMTGRSDDSAFIAGSRTDVPRLEDMLRVAVEALEKMAESPFGLDSHKFSGAVLDRLRRIAGGEA